MEELSERSTEELLEQLIEVSESIGEERIQGQISLKWDNEQEAVKDEILSRTD